MQRSALVALMILVASCRTPATEVVVTLDSDISPARRMRVHVTATGAGMSTGDAGSTVLGERGPNGQLRFPTQFTVLPAAGAARDGEATLDLAIELATGVQTITLRRRARFHFTAGERTSLRIVISSRCAEGTRHCDDIGMTCGDEGQCVAPDVTTVRGPDIAGAGICAAAAIDPANCGGCRRQCAVACEDSTCQGVVSISTGLDTSCAVLSGGSVRCWGGNQFGQLGDDLVGNHPVPERFVTVARVAEVTAGRSYVCVRDDAGAVSCRGSLALVPDSSTRTNGLVAIALPGPATSVAVGYGHACATVDGGVYCWGNNGAGQVGLSAEAVVLEPEIVPIVDARAVVAGELFSCALRGDGTVACWGRMSPTWQTGCPHVHGDGCGAARPIGGLADVTMLTAGRSHACALRVPEGEGTTVLCWGVGSFQQLGRETTADSDVAIPVIGVTGASSVAAGGMTTCVVLVDGSVRCFGSNLERQLGQSAAGVYQSGVPTVIAGITDVASAAVGDGHVCALLRSGNIHCWGRNDLGQLGDGTRVSRATPLRAFW